MRDARRNVPDPGSLPDVKRPDDEILREILGIVRGISTQLDKVYSVERRLDRASNASRMVPVHPLTSEDVASYGRQSEDDPQVAVENYRAVVELLRKLFTVTEEKKPLLDEAQGKSE